MLLGMNVLLTPPRFPPYIGGVEVHAYNLAMELSKLGCQVKVLCANEPPVNESQVYNGVEVKRLSYLFKLENTCITPSLPQLILKHNSSILHTFFPTPWSSDLSAFVGVLRNMPVVLHYYNDVTGTLKRFLYNLTLLRFTLSLVGRIVVSHPGYINRSAILSNYMEKICILPPGVNSKFLKCVSGSPTGRLGFVSVLDVYHRYKGFNTVLKALKENDVPLDVAGGGSLLWEYKKICERLGIEHKVVFHGELAYGEMPEFYRRIDALVLPTEGVEEGFGIVALEALASAKPVVVSNLVGIAKDVEMYKCGIVVDPGDVKGLSDAMQYIIDNPYETKKMGERGRALVKQNYTWTEIARKTLKIYRSVVEEKYNMKTRFRRGYVK